MYPIKIVMLEFEGFCSVVCNFNSLLKKLQSVFLTKDALRKTTAILRKVSETVRPPEEKILWTAISVSLTCMCFHTRNLCEYSRLRIHI